MGVSAILDSNTCVMYVNVYSVASSKRMYEWTNWRAWEWMLLVSSTPPYVRLSHIHVLDFCFHVLFGAHVLSLLALFIYSCFFSSHKQTPMCCCLPTNFSPFHVFIFIFQLKFVEAHTESRIIISTRTTTTTTAHICQIEWMQVQT